MANLSETAEWVTGVYQIETTDAVVGGPDGTSNTQAKQLANRTSYLKQQVELRAPIDSPAFSGSPAAPTPAPGTDSSQLATTEFVQAALAQILNAPPATLDTLNELAAALGDDPNFSATIMALLAQKAPLASPGLTGIPTAPTAAAGTSTTQLATTAFVAAALASIDTTPAGAVIAFTGSYLPAGWVRGNGAVLSRAAYPDLAAHALASGAIVSDAAWQAGDTGKYSDGDGSTTFRVPLLGGEFLRALDEGRGVDPARTIGSMQADEFEQHHHFWNAYNGTGTGSGVPVVSGNRTPTLSYRTDQLEAEPGGTETRPRNIAYPFIIKA